VQEKDTKSEDNSHYGEKHEHAENAHTFTAEFRGIKGVGRDASLGHRLYQSERRMLNHKRGRCGILMEKIESQGRRGHGERGRLAA
jgi:hypothetical protein